MNETKVCLVCGNIYIKPLFGFADFPSLRYEVNNGITLCRSCHKKRHSNIGKEYRFKKKELVYGRTG